MCFIKKPKVQQVVPQPLPQPKIEEVVQRHQADASTTKNNENNNTEGYKQNIKTSVYGLEDEAISEKKTLLGE